MNILQRGLILVLVAALPFSARAAGELVVESAWIPPAPPGMAMYAGYATLANRGDADVVITAAQSPQFDDVSIHETVVVDGVSKMRALDAITIPAGGEATLAPGGRHLMLMEPRAAIGTKVDIVFVLADGRRVTAGFVVRERD
ncbi:MAG: copper chaperone PCu(A)C [Xanthomonadales bacterium]|nr:copper chaperone PCu(A)C [Xanthomonadales bacterium]